MGKPKDSQHLRVKIVKELDTQEDDLSLDTVQKQFLCTSKEDTVEEIISYNETLDHLQNQEDQDQVEWHFKRMTSHEGTL